MSIRKETKEMNSQTSQMIQHIQPVVVMKVDQQTQVTPDVQNEEVKAELVHAAQ